ncbi:hypothetical protein KFE25_010954 [Diacronema lutheri]|uniref:DUF3598 domain-containing protein n=1 Tax=Diacronema lutheri TaxID=2081491 RepID=A0A8J6C7L4_DIALT|nr:hypothetical protein KFE25_010954 [Diacronema lutheri]
MAAILAVLLCACSAVRSAGMRTGARVVPRARPMALGNAAELERSQWELLLAHHEGFWKGVWESVDANGAPIDELEADSAWVRGKGGDTLIQVNTYFVGSVRANCEVCQDSVQARQLQVGSYACGQMPGVRLAGRGVAFGPRVTKRGALTAEVGLRDGASRLRVLFAYEPRYAPSGGPPTSLALGRVTLIREALDRPPLREEPREASVARPSGAAADFWRENDGTPLLGLWRGERAVHSADGVRHETVSPMHLRACRCAVGGAAGAEPANGCVLQLPGGITVECPRDVLPATPAELRVSWLPDGAGARLVRAALGITALGRVVAENEAEVVVTPPVCDGFAVEELERLPPAL